VRSLTFVFCLLPFVLSATAGVSYTNLAGKVIAATPVKVEENRVTFSRKASDKQTIPLSVFPPSEQKRIKAAVGVREMPGALVGLAAEIRAQRVRYEARAKAGKLSEERYAENVEMLAGSWRHAVEETDLSTEEKTYWKENVP